VPEIPVPEILDACCGGRMWWWDKKHPLAVYMDVHRAEKGSAAKFDGGKRHASPGWECEPDVLGSFTAMPFEDESFQMVVFDPPHNVRPGGPLGVNGLMYGALHPDTEQEDLRLAFVECWRVLRPGGTLIFKWAGDIKRVKPYFPATPIVGTRVPRGLQTWWLTFYKPLAVAEGELRLDV
jgi:SAM-dependent methyltransferase